MHLLISVILLYLLKGVGRRHALCYCSLQNACHSEGPIAPLTITWHCLTIDIKGTHCRVSYHADMAIALRTGMCGGGWSTSVAVRVPVSAIFFLRICCWGHSLGFCVSVGDWRCSSEWVAFYYEFVTPDDDYSTWIARGQVHMGWGTYHDQRGGEVSPFSSVCPIRGHTPRIHLPVPRCSSQKIAAINYG